MKKKMFTRKGKTAPNTPAASLISSFWLVLGSSANLHEIKQEKPDVSEPQTRAESNRAASRPRSVSSFSLFDAQNVVHHQPGTFVKFILPLV